MEMKLKSIGTIHTPFQQAAGTPIQPAFAKGTEGIVEVNSEYMAGLKDLDGFERIWLVYWFDRCGHCKLTVTPYMDTDSHGLFATRAPTRPNPIGLSPVRLMRIEGNQLFIKDADMLDGTPLLDIKPYFPRFDCFSTDRNGWLDKADTNRNRADERFHKE